MADNNNDLVAQLQNLGIESKSKAKQLVEDTDQWGCGRCPAVFNTPAELKKHLRDAEKKAKLGQGESHYYGNDNLKIDKQAFNERMGLDEDAPIRPFSEYPQEKQDDPALKATFYRMIALHATLVKF